MRTHPTDSKPQDPPTSTVQVLIPFYHKLVSCEHAEERRLNLAKCLLAAVLCAVVMIAAMPANMWDELVALLVLGCIILLGRLCNDMPWQHPEALDRPDAVGMGKQDDHTCLNV